MHLLKRWKCVNILKKELSLCIYRNLEKCILKQY